MACNKKGPPEGGPSNCVLIAKDQDATLLVVVMVLVVSVVVMVLDMELSGVVVVVVSVVVLVSLVTGLLLLQAAMLRVAMAAPARASLRRTLEVMVGPLRRLERGVANLTTQTQHGNGREPAALLQYATPD
jgi:hypothetical protein